MKDLNQSIQDFLINQIQEHQNSFITTDGVPNLFKELYDKWQNFDLITYQENILKEIKINCTEWWTNEKQGIDLSEQLDAILFEHDWDINKTEIEANAYGIIEWQDTNSYSEYFDMGYNYDFANEFEAHPGITPYLFDELACLDPAIIIDEMLNKDMEEYNGYSDLRKLYILTSYLTVHRALREFVTTPEFKKINVKDHFLFIIQEHDTIESVPIWHHFKK
jgi:hypothetical protein